MRRFDVSIAVLYFTMLFICPISLSTEVAINIDGNDAFARIWGEVSIPCPAKLNAEKGDLIELSKGGISYCTAFLDESAIDLKFKGGAMFRVQHGSKVTRFAGYRMSSFQEEADLESILRANSKQLDDFFWLQVPHAIPSESINLLSSISQLGLKVTGPESSDLLAFSKLSNITALFIDDGGELKTLDVISRLTRLKYLKIGNIPQITDFQFVKKLPELEDLELQNLNISLKHVSFGGKN